MFENKLPRSIERSGINGDKHRGTKGILLFFQKTRTLRSRGVVTLFHLFTIAIYGRNFFDVQH